MSQEVTSRRPTRGSLRGHEDPRTVLLRMAQDDERAKRIRKLKDSRPDLTWHDIAEKVGVSERSAIDWQKTGGISHDNCKKLAKVFRVDQDWLWSGRIEGTPDLMGALASDASQMGRIEAKLDALLTNAGIDPAAFDVDGVADIEEAASGSIELLGGSPEAKPQAKPAPARKRRAS